MEGLTAFIAHAITASMKSKRTNLLAALCGLSLCATDAGAVGTIRLTHVESGTSVTVTDGDPNDVAPQTGLIQFNGAVGIFSINTTAGTTKPLLGSETTPGLALSSFNVSGGAGTIKLELSDTDFSPPPNLPAYLIIGGTGDVATIRQSAYLDEGNTLFATTTQIGSTYDSGGVDPFNNDQFTTINGTGPLSMTHIVEVEHSGNGFTSFAAELGIPRGALGDYVWVDDNEDGLQDSNESGINGVTVNLYDCDDNFLRTTVTVDGPNGPGFYEFLGLDLTCYRVEFELPSGFTFTSQNEGGDDAVDSDADPVTGRTGDINLLIANDFKDYTNDAGLVRDLVPASLGDFVWFDTNNNGLQDDGASSGVPAVTVTLTGGGLDGVIGTGGDDTTATTATGPDGSYIFTGLNPGEEYKVTFSNLPTGYGFTTQDAGGDDSIDSDADPSNGMSQIVTLSSGEFNDTLDAGISILPASLGDYVWEDLNGNGIQENGEPGVEGVLVTLTDGSGNFIADQNTAPDGSYLFTGLDAGDYKVTFSNIPSGYVFTQHNVGGDDSIDSDADPLTGMSHVVTLAPGDEDLTLDAGIVPAAALGDYVWHDLNEDGIQDNNEPAVEGVLVTLTGGGLDGVIGTGGDDTTASMNTDVNGKYCFTGLNPFEEYKVTFTLPAGFDGFTIANAGGDDSIDSDANPSNGMSHIVTLAPGETNPTLDAGLITLKASLGDYVWLDLNGNGIQENGEPGVEGVLVTLTDGSGNFIADQNTAADGSYLFTDLDPGSYKVTFSNLPADHGFTIQNAGGDDTLDSDADPSNGMTQVVVLVGGDSNTTLDAGLVFCALTIDAKCRVLFQTDPTDDACEGKVERLVMLYTGQDCSASVHNQDDRKVSCWSVTGPLPDTVHITVSDRQDIRDSRTVIWFEGEVSIGDTFEIAAANANRDELKGNTYIRIIHPVSCDVLQKVKFHTSCSDPLAPGNQFGASLIMEMETTGGGVVTNDPPEPPAAEDHCVIPAPRGSCDGKPQLLQLLYTGQPCSESRHSQDSDKARCWDHGTLTESVYVRATTESDPNDTGGDIWFEGTVELGEVFELTAANAGEDKLGSNTYIHVFASNGGALLQRIQFHTSCSQPLNLTDQFGSMLVVGMDTKDGPLQTYPEVEFIYTVTNTGTAPITDLVLSDWNGPIAGVDPNLGVGESFELTVSTVLFESLTNLVRASAGNGACEAEDTVTVVVEEPPTDCCANGRPNVLVFEYTGDDCSASNHQQGSKAGCWDQAPLLDSVYIIAKNKDRNRILFEGWVVKGGTFEVKADGDKFDSEIGIWVKDGPGGNTLQDIKIHTSCSVPLFTGDQFGSAKLLDCRTEDDANPADCCDGRKVKALIMRYTANDCSATSHSQDPSKVVCRDHQALPDLVYIVANDRESAHDGNIWFQGWVPKDGVFAINAAGSRKDRLGGETRIHIFDRPCGQLLQFVKFHTSCSQPLLKGDNYGAAELVDCIHTEKDDKKGKAKKKHHGKKKGHHRGRKRGRGRR